MKLHDLYITVKEKIKNAPYLFAFITALIILLIPMIIFLLYFMGDNFRVLVYTSLSVGDALGIYGSLLSFIGTVLLGYIAIWQNDKANRINKRLTDIEERRYVLELQPFVIVSEWEFFVENHINILFSNKDNLDNKIFVQIDEIENENGSCACLAIDFINTSNTYIMLSYFGCKLYDGNKYLKSWSNCVGGRTNYKLYMNLGQKGTLVFYSDWKCMSEFVGKRLELELILQNKYSEPYKETIEIWVIDIHTEANYNYAILQPQNYNIENLTVKEYV